MQDNAEVPRDPLHCFVWVHGQAAGRTRQAPTFKLLQQSVDNLNSVRKETGRSESGTG